MQIFDWMADTVSSVFNSVTELFGSPEEYFDDVAKPAGNEYEIYGVFNDDFSPVGKSVISSGAEWLAKKAPSAIASGFSTLAAAGQQGKLGGRTSAGRMGNSLSGLNMPIRSMSKASPVSPLKSENWATYDSYWADRMRNFGRMNDMTAATRTVKAVGNQ